MPFVAAPLRRRLVFLLVACLAAALGGLFTSSARAANTAPVAIVIDGITGESLTGLDLGTLPPGAAPSTFVRAGGDFSIQVSFHDSTGALAAFNNDTTLAITGTTNSGAATLSPATVVVPKGNMTYDLHTSIADAANQVVLTVAVAGKKPSTVAAGVSYVPNVKDLRFDVVSDARTESGGAGFQQGIGGDQNCTNATSSAPVCAIVVLPQGAGPNVLLSVGACDPSTLSPYAPCFAGPRKTGGAILQTLFAQPTAPSATPYSTTSPATVIFKCDKSLCGNGPIQDLTVGWSLSGNGVLVDALACPAKNTMAAEHTPCVDYVQSKRDGAGDTHLYLLTDGDLRGGIS
jgi:hypothetical protein